MYESTKFVYIFTSSNAKADDNQIVFLFKNKIVWQACLSFFHFPI